MGEKLALRGEFHCHDKFSNYHGSYRLPWDCGTDTIEQMFVAYTKNLDFIWKTNHNTVKGYDVAIEYQREHKDSPLSKSLKVFPGVEMSASLSRYDNDHVFDASISRVYENGKGSDIKEGHILGYAVLQDIHRGMTAPEIIDEIRSQGGISCAAHPAAVTAGLWKEAPLCDLIEGMNSNNNDRYSNYGACVMAKKNGKFVIGGSDAHITNELGNCLVEVYVQDMNKEDVTMYDVTNSVMKGDFRVIRAVYNTERDFKEHLFYQMSNSEKLQRSIEEEFGPWAGKIAKYFIGDFLRNQDAWWVKPASKIMKRQMGNVSKKVNCHFYDEAIIIRGSWGDRIKESLMPLRKSKSTGGMDFRKVNDELKKFDFEHMENELNELNDQLRGRPLFAQAA